VGGRNSNTKKFNCNNILFSTCLLINLSLVGQQTTGLTISQKLDEYLNSANTVYKFNGSALIAEKGRVLLAKGYGLKNVSTHLINDTNTIFQIGSITKSFTAIVILKLQEEGKLSVYDKLNKFFPGFPKADKITIQNLLTHTSGIHNYTDIIGEEDSAIVCFPVTREKILEAFENKGLLFKPGKKFVYSNSGYFLLGMIIERVTGKQYETVVREMIFDPLHMDQSGFDYKKVDDINKAQGYIILNNDSLRINRTVDSTVYYSAGSMYSSVTDLYKWVQAIADHKLLNDSSWQQAFTPFKNKYGFGFFLDSLYGKSYIRHSGGLLGFTSDLIYYPKEDVTIILLNNVGDYGNSLFPVAAGITSIVFGLPYTNWKHSAALNIEEATLKTYVGTYIFNADHKLIVSYENGSLFVRDTNPKDMLPKVRLYAESENMFYMKEAQLRFEFVRDEKNNPIKLVTYNTNGKDAEWIRVK
jgi:CubicO group peptidase (beta-lactamase class C family)